MHEAACSVDWTRGRLSASSGGRHSLKGGIPGPHVDVWRTDLNISCRRMWSRYLRISWCMWWSEDLSISCSRMRFMDLGNSCCCMCSRVHCTSFVAQGVGILAISIFALLDRSEARPWTEVGALAPPSFSPPFPDRNVASRESTNHTRPMDVGLSCGGGVGRWSYGQKAKLPQASPTLIRNSNH